MTIVGGGFLSLEGNNTYSGATNVSAGTLQSAPWYFSSSPNSSFFVDVDGILDVNGLSGTIGALSDGLSGGGIVISSSGAATLTVGANGRRAERSAE